MDSLVADLPGRRAYLDAVAVDCVKKAMADQAGPQTLRERLAASHAEQCASVSHLAFNAHWGRFLDAYGWVEEARAPA